MTGNTRIPTSVTIIREGSVTLGRYDKFTRYSITYIHNGKVDTAMGNTREGAINRLLLYISAA